LKLNFCFEQLETKPKKKRGFNWKTTVYKLSDHK